MTAVLGRTAPPALDADWMHDAACRTDDVDPDMFFLDRYTHDRVDTAKSNRAGVWAGTTPSQRDAIYRRQRRETINA